MNTSRRRLIAILGLCGRFVKKLAPVVFVVFPLLLREVGFVVIFVKPSYQRWLGTEFLHPPLIQLGRFRGECGKPLKDR